MPMRVRLAEWAVMGMLVMLVMYMRVLVFQRPMLMLVVVTFGQMKPKTNRHENTCRNDLKCHGLAENYDCKHRTDERR